MSVVLRHGADPLQELARAGLRPTTWLAARRGPADELLLECEVDSAPTLARAAQPLARPTQVPHAEGLVIGSGEVAVRVQRVSAVVVVQLAGSLLNGPVLLTQYSHRTRRPGHWGLPGGGVETGEDPVAAAVRECWEETGHHVEVAGLLGVATDRFVGRAPHGRLEDFHAIHLVYAGSCDEASEPVLHDVDGSTQSAAWVLPGDLPGLQLTPMARRHLRLAGVATGAH